MIKKIVITSAILTASTAISFAAGAPYLGVGLGLTNNTSNNASYRGIPLTLSGGFGATINQNIYLAGEIFANFATSTLNNNVGSVSLKTTYGYGISFIPGVMLSDHSMTFLRLGLIKTRFSSLDNTATGGQIGWGLQTGITQNWDLRGEYDYTKYRHVSGVSPKADTFNVSFIYKFE
ncbi:MAG: hypothetical protein ACD_45C00124G0002 [uncultured bacterium]|nr:MAG: hypothetical protein ACD_45C00124G0002 [uncultured bacterium]